MLMMVVVQCNNRGSMQRQFGELNAVRELVHYQKVYRVFTVCPKQVVGSWDVSDLLGVFDRV